MFPALPAVPMLSLSTVSHDKAQRSLKVVMARVCLAILFGAWTKAMLRPASHQLSILTGASSRSFATHGHVLGATEGGNRRFFSNRRVVRGFWRRISQRPLSNMCVPRTIDREGGYSEGEIIRQRKKFPLSIRLEEPKRLWQGCTHEG